MTNAQLPPAGSPMQGEHAHGDYWSYGAAVLDAMVEGAALADAAGRCRSANAEFARLVGVPPGELVGASLTDHFDTGIFRDPAPALERLRAGKPLAAEGWRALDSGDRRYLTETATPLPCGPDEPVGGFLLVVKDLTAHKRAEATLKDLEQAQTSTDAYYSAIVNSGLDGIVVIDEQGKVVDFNPAAEVMFGYRKDAILDQAIASLIIPPEFRDAHNSGMAAYLATGQSRVLDKRLELSAMRSDGVQIPVELTITDVTRQGRRLFAAHIRDLSAAKRAEEEIKAQRNALYQKEKLAALGSLLAGVAHELNNPLSIVTGQTMMLREQMMKDAASLPGYERLLQRCDRIESAADRCARVVRSFLSMARQQVAERKPSDLAAIAKSALDLLKYNLQASGIRVDTAFPLDLPAILLDADQIHQVLLNLLVNSQQALEEQAGERTIAISARVDPDEAVVILALSDNGPGVSGAIRSRIFDPYFTTKPQGSGTGIGLAVSRGIVEAHGGSLDLDEGADAGARFVIRLPLDPAPDAMLSPAAQGQPAIAADPARGSVLVVDDEPDIAATLAEIAEGMGFEVVLAGSGGDAHKQVERRDGAFEAILCDVRMPGGDGLSFYDWLLANHPALARRIGFITGDTLGPAAGRFLARSGCPIIEKPFTPTDVRRFLDDLVKAERD